MNYRILILSFLLVFNTSIYASDDIVATVSSIYDGDTFYINIPDIHPVFGKHLGIRVNGIDTPELRDTRIDKRESAKLARSIAKTKLEGKSVRLYNIKRDKYFRLRADVEILDSRENFGQFMLDTKLAQPYHGEKRK